MTNYKEHFDVVFFSPPYYEFEKYPGQEQSINRYSTYEEWLEKYWKSTVELCYNVLQKGGRLCYILSSYDNCYRSSNCIPHDLIKDMNSIVKERFSYKRMIPMYNKNVHVTSHRETGEKIFLFMKE
jgi:16S rRNA G966 N2-methylase RsmD